MTGGHRSRTSMAALVISLIALFVALDGPGYAQKFVQSIDGHEIKTGTIDANRLSKSAQRALTGKQGLADDRDLADDRALRVQAVATASRVPPSPTRASTWSAAR